MTVALPISVEDQELRDSLQVKAPQENVDWINLLVYGGAGVGKTYLLGTAEDAEHTSPLLIADIEGGLTTIRHRPNVDTVPIRSMKDIENLYNKLYTSIRNGKIYYGTVGIDSLTELADLDMRINMKEALANARDPSKIDIDVPSPREWGKTRNHIRTIVRAFRDLPCNVIYTAHVGMEVEEGQPTKFHPGFSGKLRAEVPGFMDIVGYYTADAAPGGEVTRKLQLQATRRVVAKDRTSALGELLVNPTIPMMWDMILASQVPATQVA